jgi:hypothetical protein
MICYCPEKLLLDEATYLAFDSTCKQELVQPIKADDIINKSTFCTSIPRGFLAGGQGDAFNASFLLQRIKDKIGVYHLWKIAASACPVHRTYSMECVYVGKGNGFDRATVHLGQKFLDTPQFYISFYECENRIAKYLEQLFLDTYTFELNKKECIKDGPKLYAFWGIDRYEIGTETAFLADEGARIATNKIAEQVDKALAILKAAAARGKKPEKKEAAVKKPVKQKDKR